MLMHVAVPRNQGSWCLQDCKQYAPQLICISVWTEAFSESHVVRQHVKSGHWVQYTPAVTVDLVTIGKRTSGMMYPGVGEQNSSFQSSLPSLDDARSRNIQRLKLCTSILNAEASIKPDNIAYFSTMALSLQIIEISVLLPSPNYMCQPEDQSMLLQYPALPGGLSFCGP